VLASLAFLTPEFRPPEKAMAAHRMKNALLKIAEKVFTAFCFFFACGKILSYQPIDSSGTSVGILL